MHNIMSCYKTYDPCLDNKINQIGSYAATARKSAECAQFSEGQAETAATSALSNATLAQNLYNDFSEKYLGSFATPPAPPIKQGALYYNTVSNGLFVWNGTVWVSADFNEFTNFTATGTTTARNLVTRMADVVNVLDFGADPTGVINSQPAIQAALDAVGSQGKSIVFLPKGTYKILSPLLVWSNTKICGSGIGSTKIVHPSSHAFKNKNYLSTGDESITISDIEFDANQTADGAISMQGIRQLICQNLKIERTDPTGVTVGIGLSPSPSSNSKDILISNCTIDVEDYGIVCDATSPGEVSQITIESCIFTTAWGSCISFAGNIKEATISDNIFNMPGDGVPSAGTDVGFGVKLWQGLSATVAPMDITITGNTFIGKQLPRVNITGIAASNWAQSLIVSSNTFKLCSEAFRNDFSGLGVNGLSFSNNIVTECDGGVQSELSTDTEMSFIGNQFINCGNGIKSTLRDGIISSNKFKNITGKGIWLLNPAEHCNISSNVLKNIGQEAIYFDVGGSSSDTGLISDNQLFNTCTSADDTFSSIELKNQSHSVTGNVVLNEGTVNKPSWIIGGTGNWRVIVGNFFYGARQNYRETVGANDVYASNAERGGIP